jgi:hypothetical protein
MLGGALAQQQAQQEQQQHEALQQQTGRQQHKSGLFVQHVQDGLLCVARVQASWWCRVS